MDRLIGHRQNIDKETKHIGFSFLQVNANQTFHLETNKHQFFLSRKIRPIKFQLKPQHTATSARQWMILINKTTKWFRMKLFKLFDL